MASSVGVLSKAGHGTASSWGAAWSAVTKQFPIKSENIVQNWIRIQNENLCGSPARNASDQGPLSVKGTIEAELDYTNFQDLLYEGLGAHDVGSLFGIADQIGTNCFRLEFDKQISRWRVGSARMNAFEISGKAGESLKLAMDFICRDIARTATAFPSLSITSCKRIMFDEVLGGFMIGDCVDELDTPDAQPVEEFRLRFERNLTDPEWDLNNPVYTIAPEENGFRKVTLDLTLSRYGAVDYFNDWADADTPLQGIVMFMNPVDSSLFKIYMPWMKIVSSDFGIGGPSVIKPKVQLELYRNENTVMDSDVGEFWMGF